MYFSDFRVPLPLSLTPGIFLGTPGTIWSKIMHQNHCSEMFHEISDFGLYFKM